VRTKDELKADICEVGRRLYERRYIAAGEGNVSIRVSDGELLATPTGVCKGYMTPDMIVTCDLSGKQLAGDMRVSTEIQMHLAVYKAREDVKAIVHAHPPTSTGFAVAGVPLNKAVLAEVVVTMGCIPLAEYGTPSTKELADSVERLVRMSDGLLLSNHGALTVGKDIFDAYYKMEVVEHFAEVSLVSRVLGGERLLTGDEVSRLLSLRSKVYGLEGPAGGEACPVPGDTPSRKASDRIEMSRDELVHLIMEAVRELGGTESSLK
jgi:L-fuculose-phosphate aldolase